MLNRCWLASRTLPCFTIEREFLQLIPNTVIRAAHSRLVYERRTCHKCHRNLTFSAASETCQFHLPTGCILLEQDSTVAPIQPDFLCRDYGHVYPLSVCFRYQPNACASAIILYCGYQYSLAQMQALLPSITKPAFSRRHPSTLHPCPPPLESAMPSFRLSV